MAIYINSILYTATYKLDENGQLVTEYMNINFMYVVNPPADLPFLKKYPLMSDGTGGWLVYIIHYAFLSFVVVTLTFIKPIVLAIKEKKNCNKATA